MSTVLFLVTSIWTLPHLFKVTGLDIVIEDGGSNVTVFESLLQENETNSTVQDIEMTTTITFSDPTTILQMTNESVDVESLVTTPDSATEEMVFETTIVEEEEESTTLMQTTPLQTTVFETSTLSTMAAETTKDPSIRERITVRIPDPQTTSVVAVFDNTDLVKYYGEECGLEGGLQCDAGVKCRGRGTIDCNIKDEIEGVRPNISIKSESETNRELRVSAAQTSPEYCRVVGKVICFPSPNIANCKGQGSCVPVSEQTFGRGLQDWEIAVITVLCVVGLLLIFLMVYILYSSFKKLKVRPDAQRYPSAQTA